MPVILAIEVSKILLDITSCPRRLKKMLWLQKNHCAFLQARLNDLKSKAKQNKKKSTMYASMGDINVQRKYHRRQPAITTHHLCTTMKA